MCLRPVGRPAAVFLPRFCPLRGLLLLKKPKEKNKNAAELFLRENKIGNVELFLRENKINDDEAVRQE